MVTMMTKQNETEELNRAQRILLRAMVAIGSDNMPVWRYLHRASKHLQARQLEVFQSVLGEVRP